MKFHSLNQQVIDALKAGQIDVIPTDTVYGVVACAADKTAVEKLYKLKKREQKPGTVIAASIDQLEQLGIKHRDLKAVENYWPNPISIVVPTGFELKYLHQGKMSLAARIPADKILHEFLEKTGPLVTSSANHPGEKPAETIKQAQKYFGDTLDFYVDGGNLHGNEASTIIRVTNGHPEVLRAGAVTINTR